MFIQVHPVLAVKDVSETARWFREKLGFEPLFCDDEREPRYAGLSRDGIQIHLQWHGQSEWDNGLCGGAYRFLVEDPDALFTEFDSRGAIPEGKSVGDTGWGTREFGLYDPSNNALFFYKDSGAASSS